MKFGTRITERGPGALRDGVSTYIGVNWRRKMARVASGVVLRRPTMFILVLQLFSMAHYMRLSPLLIQWPRMVKNVAAIRWIYSPVLLDIEVMSSVQPRDGDMCG